MFMQFVDYAKILYMEDTLDQRTEANKENIIYIIFSEKEEDESV